MKSLAGFDIGFEFKPRDQFTSYGQIQSFMDDLKGYGHEPSLGFDNEFMELTVVIKGLNSYDEGDDIHIGAVIASAPMNGFVISRVWLDGTEAYIDDPKGLWSGIKDRLEDMLEGDE